MIRKTRQKAKQTGTAKVSLANLKVNRANSKVNRAYSQFRDSGILFRQRNGKLCFLQQTIVLAAKNNLPPRIGRGEETHSEVVHFRKYNGFLSACSIWTCNIFTTKIQ
ncbi:MAG: hypothetical protein LBN27_06585 [Prevotellaceae bacterium]|jgi:hypothetical protein|nr:hypothetical protein [Prevotellaceae bacterium]